MKLIHDISFSIYISGLIQVFVVYKIDNHKQDKKYSIIVLHNQHG